MSNVLDLDAAKRERANDDIVIRFAGNDLSIPGELPADVFDPFLSPDFDLVAIIKAFLDADTASGDDAGFLDQIGKVLDSNPNLASKVLAALKDSYRLLLGADNYAVFLQGKPSLLDYLALTKGLLGLYGVGLGEAFASFGSSETAGATSNPTSPTTTDSTPATAGATPDSAPGS